MEHQDWYKKWFNTKYYHLLYKNRDEKEAELFIANSIQHIKLKKEAKVWDNACGIGRHCYILSKYGFEVVGTDICENNINIARSKYSNQNTSFYIHDMRREFYINYFDLAINIFTSIGYFENIYENSKMIQVMFNSVKKGGFILIDFFNPDFVKKNIIEKESKTIEGIVFNIRKKIVEDWVIKQIEVFDAGNKYVYLEKVKLLPMEFFLNNLKKYGINNIEVFGDYSVSAFSKNVSERMIFLVKK